MTAKLFSLKGIIDLQIIRKNSSNQFRKLAIFTLVAIVSSIIISSIVFSEINSTSKPSIEKIGNYDSKTNASPQIDSNLLAKVSLPFIENNGQINQDVKFYSNTFAGTFFVTNDGITYSLNNDAAEEVGSAQGVAIKERFLSYQPLNPKGIEKNNAIVNYFIGEKENWRNNIPTYNSVSLGEVWPSVDVELKAYGKNVEKIFKLAPGGNVDDIRLEFQGVRSLDVSNDGELLLETALGTIAMTKPFAFQEIDGARTEVDVSYFVDGNTYGFDVTNYNPNHTLIIDPLLGSTFIGGGNGEEGLAIAIDNATGNVFVTGFARLGYPTTVGVYDTSFNGPDTDVFVSKLNNDLTTLMASTFIGGSLSEQGKGIAIFGSRVYVTGSALSGYPTILGSYDLTNDGSYDVFVSLLNNDLTSLVASTFIGGTGSDEALGIATDVLGNVFVTGYSNGGYATAGSPYDSTFNGGSQDVIVSKLDSNLTTLLASTFVGSANTEQAYGIAIDGSGNVFVTGFASTGYPTTTGAYSQGPITSQDAFVSKLDNNLSTLMASTFIGGPTTDQAFAIAIDGADNVFVTGFASAGYPTTHGAYDETHNGGADVFVSKLDKTLSTLPSSTFIGGTGSEQSRGITVDGSGNVFVTGFTAAGYPTTPGAYDVTYNNGDDVFVSKLNNDLTTLSASTFIGGASHEFGFGIDTDSSGNVFVTGFASAGYPTTTGASDDTFNGGSQDVFVSKFTNDLSASVSPPTITLGTPSTTTPKWDYSVSISGSTTNAIGGDTVTVLWGDGTTTTGVTISGGGWGPVLHTYPVGSIATNPNLLKAEIIRASVPVATSTSIPINVQKHLTSLSTPTLSSSAVPWGNTYKVTSITLTDVDAVGGPAPVAGKTIAFSGTAVTGTPSGLTSLSGLSASVDIVAPGAGNVGAGEVRATFAGDSAYMTSATGSISNPDATIDIVKHITTLSAPVLSSATVPWGNTFQVLTTGSTLTDINAVGGPAPVAGKTIAFSGTAVTGTPTGTTVESLVAPVNIVAPSPGGANVGPGKTVVGTFAGDTDYESSASPAATIEILKHMTELTLDFIPDPIQGTLFNAKGNSLTDLDAVGGPAQISGKTITFDGTGVGTPALEPAVTGGITFTGTGMAIVSGTFSPNPETSDPITKALEVQEGTTITLPPDSAIVAITIQNSDNNPFTITGTNVEGSTCEITDADTSPSITTANLDCGGPSISNVVFTSIGTGSESLKLTQIKTFKPSTVDSNLIKANFEGEPIGPTTSVTVAKGAYHSTTAAINSVSTEDQIVQAHFAEDADYYGSDSNIRTYLTQLSLGVGGSVTAKENYVKSFTSIDCGAGNDDDGDALCDIWETTGVPYNAGGISYNYVLPGTPNPNKKNIYVELDAMTGRAPSMAAGGPIDRVKTAFANAPVTNVAGQSNGILLDVDDDDTSLTLASAMDVWVDFDGDPNDDFGTIKGRFFGTSAQRPGIGGTQVDTSSGSVLSYATTISGVTISPPGDTSRNTEGTVFMKQRVTLSTGCVVGAATVTRSGSSPANLSFPAPSVEVITPDAVTPHIKILLVKQPFTMTSAFTTANNDVGTMNLTVPIVDNPSVAGTCTTSTFTLTTPPIPATLTTTLLNAKAQTVHYALFANSIGACGPSGIAENKGNDFIVSLGCGFANSNDEIAGTFMHELGHNLDLGHGGPKEIAGASISDSSENCKPLYTSVMSYSRQMPTYFTAGNFKLDYSRGFFASPALSLAELQLNEQLGLRASTIDASIIPQIVYGTPGLTPEVRTASGTAALAAATVIDWNGNGVTENLGGTHTTAISDGSVGSGNTGTFTLSNLPLTTAAVASAGSVNIRTILDFGGTDPGPVTTSASVAAGTGYTIVSGSTVTTVSGVGDVRIVDISFRFTKSTAGTDVSIGTVTVTISGATADATFTTTEGPAQVNLAYSTSDIGTNNNPKISKVKGTTITSTTSGTVYLIQKVNLGASRTLTLTTPTQTGQTTQAGLSWGPITASSVGASGANSATTASTIHTITISIPFTLTSGSLNDALVGEITYSLGLSSATYIASAGIVSGTNSPSFPRVDVNNFGITGCNTALVNTVEYKDYNDWVNLKYNFRGAAGSLLNARMADHEPDASEIQEQINNKNMYSGVLPPLNQNILPPVYDMSKVKRQQTVPNKFILKDGDGLVVTDAQVTFVAQATGLACGPDIESEVLPTAVSTSGTLFKFTDGQYLYNWKVPNNWPLGVTGLKYIKDSGSANQSLLTHFDTSSEHSPYSLKICVGK